MKTATELIHKTVIPAIDKTYTEVDDKIKELLKETFEKKRETEAELQKAEENKRALQQQSFWHAVLAPFKMMASVISLAGPEGMAVGAVIGLGVGVAEKVVDGTTTTNAVSVPPGIYRNKILRVAEQAKGKTKLLKAKLEDLQKIFQNEDMSHFESILKNVDKTLKVANEVVDKHEIPGLDVLDYLKKQHEELSGAIDTAAEAFKNNPKYNTTSKNLGYAQAVVGFVGGTLDLYETVRNDQGKLAEAGDMIGKLKDQLKIIELHEQNINNIMIPQAKMMEQSMNEAMKNAANKSHAVLDVSKWTLQSSLKDVKKLFNDMTQGFEVAGDIERCVEKLNEGITTVIDVYDRIDAYSEKSQLATLIADIAIGSNEIQDPKLRHAVSQTEKIINTNFGIEQYETALRALKQHKFPFAQL